MEMFEVKQKFANAMYVLMKHKPISKISITTLAKEAGLSRPTLYRYFADIYELIEWMYLKDKMIVLDFYDNGGDLEASVYYQLEVMLKNKILYEKTLSIENGSFFLNCSYCRMESNLRKYVSNKQELTPDIEFSIKFFSAALSQIFYLWIKNGLAITPKELGRQIIKNTPNSLLSVLS